MSYLNRLKQLFLPYTCILCGEIANQPRDLCQTCEKSLPWLAGTCHQCGLRLPSGAEGNTCGECSQTARPFDRTYALCDYADPINHMISAAKFNNHLVYTRLLGELLAERVKHAWYTDALPELLIPMPLHRKRLGKRGYNQALEITKIAAKRLKLPYNIDACIRHKATQPQAQLSPAERTDNIKAAFTLHKPITAKHVAIIDDVVTTGQTVGELCKVLRAGGVEKIDVWCCARTQWGRGGHSTPPQDNCRA